MAIRIVGVDLPQNKRGESYVRLSIDRCTATYV